MGMRLAIMQPYYLPLHIRYFQSDCGGGYVSSCTTTSNTFEKRLDQPQPHIAETARTCFFAYLLKTIRLSGCMRTGAGCGFQSRQTALKPDQGSIPAYAIFCRAFPLVRADYFCMKRLTCFRFLPTPSSRLRASGITTEIRVSSDIASTMA